MAISFSSCNNVAMARVDARKCGNPSAAAAASEANRKNIDISSRGYLHFIDLIFGGVCACATERRNVVARIDDDDSSDGSSSVLIDSYRTRSCGARLESTQRIAKRWAFCGWASRNVYRLVGLDCRRIYLNTVAQRRRQQQREHTNAHTHTHVHTHKRNAHPARSARARAI